MSLILPTVKIEPPDGSDGYWLINADDFNPAEHKEWGAVRPIGDAKAKRKQDPAKE